MMLNNLAKHIRVLCVAILLFASTAWTDVLAAASSKAVGRLEVHCIEEYGKYCDGKLSGFKFSDGCRICKCEKDSVLCKKGPCQYFSNIDEDALDYCDSVLAKNSAAYDSYSNARSAARSKVPESHGGKSESNNLKIKINMKSSPASKQQKAVINKEIMDVFKSQFGDKIKQSINSLESKEEESKPVPDISGKGLTSGSIRPAQNKENEPFVENKISAETSSKDHETADDSGINKLVQIGGTSIIENYPKHQMKEIKSDVEMKSGNIKLDINGLSDGSLRPLLNAGKKEIDSDKKIQTIEQHPIYIGKQDISLPRKLIDPPDSDNIKFTFGGSNKKENKLNIDLLAYRDLIERRNGAPKSHQFGENNHPGGPTGNLLSAMHRSKTNGNRMESHFLGPKPLLSDQRIPLIQKPATNKIKTEKKSTGKSENRENGIRLTNKEFDNLRHRAEGLPWDKHRKMNNNQRNEVNIKPPHILPAFDYVNPRQIMSNNKLPSWSPIVPKNIQSKEIRGKKFTNEMLPNKHNHRGNSADQNKHNNVWQPLNNNKDAQNSGLFANQPRHIYPQHGNPGHNNLNGWNPYTAAHQPRHNTNPMQSFFPNNEIHFNQYPTNQMNPGNNNWEARTHNFAPLRNNWNLDQSNSDPSLNNFFVPRSQFGLPNNAYNSYPLLRQFDGNVLSMDPMNTQLNSRIPEWNIAGNEASYPNYIDTNSRKCMPASIKTGHDSINLPITSQLDGGYIKNFLPEHLSNFATNVIEEDHSDDDGTKIEQDKVLNKVRNLLRLTKAAIHLLIKANYSGSKDPSLNTTEIKTPLLLNGSIDATDKNSRNSTFDFNTMLDLKSIVGKMQEIVPQVEKYAKSGEAEDGKDQEEEEEKDEDGEKTIINLQGSEDGEDAEDTKSIQPSSIVMLSKIGSETPDIMEGDELNELETLRDKYAHCMALNVQLMEELGDRNIT